ncbi:MAG: LON peptidase substrate-binding domain-containing protein [Acidimicrobiia bacterium]
MGGQSFVDHPMFPLGQPLLPGALLPLQVFEPRYVTMMRRCLESPEPTFGVVMIERGHEVGGGDVRARVATDARIVDVTVRDDGRLAVMAVGGERLRVLSWLEDDPHPRARVESWPDEDDGLVAAADIAERLDAVRTTLDLVERLGGPRSDVPDLDGLDGSMATHALGTIAPLGSVDRFRMLSAPGPRARLAAFDVALSEVTDALRFRLDG